jgi:polyphosphate kinase 2 (PPK2 family)
MPPNKPDLVQEPDGKKQTTEARLSSAEGRIQQNDAQGIRKGAREAPSRAFATPDLDPSHGRTHYRGLRGAGHSRQGRRVSRITARTSPRVFRHVALPAPSDREKTQVYAQRYIAHFPAAGEIILFDRSWYNMAGVDRVMGFCTEEEYERFLLLTPAVEREIVVQNGTILRKYFLDISQDEQRRRFEARIDDPVKHWKLSPMDIESVRRWWDYTAAYSA